MTAVLLESTLCPICNTSGNATELCSANIAPEVFTPQIFSARRLPDRLHYRMVRCDACGLVRSDPVATADFQARLYSESTVEYGEHIADLDFTYGRYLSRLERFGVSKGALLEIGCGNGFFLKEALRQGYRAVYGVEPSTAAVRDADPAVRSQVVCDVMRPNLFPQNRFDVLCMFQVFDHIPDPNALLDECFRVLKPGGLVLCLNHNVDALSARLLGSRSPIFDVEHTFLYSPRTISAIFGQHGFAPRAGGRAYNRYALSYLVRLLPLPAPFKRLILSVLTWSRLARFRLLLPIGNLYLVAQKPYSAEPLGA